MFETAVGDGTEKLWLQEEVAETGCVDADIGTLLVWCAARDGQVASLGITVGGSGSGGWCSSLGGLELLVGVVDEILLSRHVGGC